MNYMSDPNNRGSVYGGSGADEIATMGGYSSVCIIFSCNSGFYYNVVLGLCLVVYSMQ